MTPLRLPVPRLSEDEMREIVVGRMACDLMFGGEIPQSVRHLCLLPLGMGAFSPPPQLVKAVLGSSEPPETLDEDPSKPEHPGYPPPPGEPPEKPVLGTIPPELLNELEWGDVEEEEVEAAKEAVEQENRKRIRDWEKASFQWHDDLEAHRQARREADAAHEEAVREWRSALSQHEDAKRCRQEAYDEWVRRYDEVFQEWYADVGEIMGRMKDALPRGINGCPMFAAVTLIHKDDWDRIEAAVLREQERRSSISV